MFYTLYIYIFILGGGHLGDILVFSLAVWPRPRQRCTLCITWFIFLNNLGGTVENVSTTHFAYKCVFFAILLRNFFIKMINNESIMLLYSYFAMECVIFSYFCVNVWWRPKWRPFCSLCDELLRVFDINTNI